MTKDNRRGILAIGNLIVDRTHKISQYPPESMLAIIRETAASPGGGAGNVLFDLARVTPDLPLAIAGQVGDDADGLMLRQAFSAQGIDTNRVGVVGDRPTSFTHVMISETGATRTFFHGHGANDRLDLDFVAAIDGQHRIAHLAYLLLLNGLDREDAGYGSAGAHALALLRDKGFRVSLDLVSDGDTIRYQRFVKPALPFVDYLIINDVEAANLTGTAPATRNGAVDWTAAEQQTRLLRQAGVRDLIAIHFPEGAVALDMNDVCVRQSAYHVAKSDVVSTLGAGDAFCAGLLYGLHEALPVSDCLKLGMALAHFNLFAASATDGAVPLAELQALIKTREA